MRCERCDTDIPDGFRYCGQCGAPRPGRCEACDFENPPGMRFCGRCGASLGAATPPAADAPSMQPASHPGRRQLTILFADLVGSTPLSYQLDPEDLRELIRAYQQQVASVVARYEGTVSRYMGDGVLCLFGYPRAHEDDAERAVHAGLDIVAAMATLNERHGQRHSVRLQVRVGIATGLVIVGDIIGEGASEEQAVVGETPNLAARLQSVAEPDQVVIAASTRHLAGRVFDYEDLGKVPVRGLPEPVRLNLVRGRRFVESRFELTRAAVLSPMIGRHDQLASLGRAFESAAGGDGHVVVISGEGGVGKSRLVESLLQQTAGRRHIRLRYQCSAHHGVSTLYPVASHLERNADIAPGDDDQTRLAKLGRLLHPETPNRERSLAVLADLVGAPVGSATAALSPRQQRVLLIETLLEQADLMARERLLLLVFEDVQWMDPTTRELLDRLVERVPLRRMLAVVITRPSFEAAWLTQPHVARVDLGRLDRREATQMIREVAGVALPPRVVADIVGKSDGVPLFIEELTRSVLQANPLRERDGHWLADGETLALSVPATLQDSLVARLDELPGMREVAQTAATLGREFGFDLLAALLPMPADELRDALEQLVGGNILERRGTPEAGLYSFRHALLQDACYESMLRRTRLDLHARIAEMLLQRFPETVTRQPEIIAHHFSQAQRPELAVDYWIEAGRRASEHSASVEAVRHLSNGLAALRKLPDEASRVDRELPLLTMLGAALINAEGPASAEAQRVYARARELRAGGEDDVSLERFAALWGEWRICSNEWSARQLAVEMVGLAHQRGDQDLLLQAHHANWATLFVLGELESCLQSVDEGLAVYDCERHARHATLYGGHDAGVCGLGQAALTLALCGDFNTAGRRMNEALALAAQTGHGASLAHAYDHNMMLLYYRRDPARLLKLAGGALNHAERHDCADYRARAETFLACARFELEQREDDRDLLRASIAEQRNTMGDSDDLPVFLDMLAAVALHERHFQAAQQHIDEGLALAERHGTRHWRAELLRRRAALLLTERPDARAQAETLLRDAMEQAREQGARLLLLRVLHDLCALVEQDRAPSVALRALCDELALLGTCSDIEGARDWLQAAGV